MIIVVGGLGNDKEYFGPLLKCLERATQREIHVHLLTHGTKLARHQEALRELINNQHDKRTRIDVVAFSMGCLLVLNAVPSFEHDNLKITFVNPSNTFMELSLDHSRYFGDKYGSYTSLCSRPTRLSTNVTRKLRLLRVMFAMCKYMNLYNQLIWLYMYFVGNKLREPVELIQEMSSYDYNDLHRHVEECGMSINWFESVKSIEGTTLKRIKIVSGCYDRYNRFAHLLTEMYSHLFVLHGVNGGHHILHNNPDLLVSNGIILVE
jgi:hypothetical protein